MPGYKREFQQGNSGYGGQMPSMGYGSQMPQMPQMYGPQMQPRIPQYLGNPMYGGDQMTFGGQSPYGGQQQPQFMSGVTPDGYPQMQGNEGMRRPRRLGRFTPFMESTNPFAAIE